MNGSKWRGVGIFLFLAITFVSALPAHAINWVILQGTEPAHSDGRPKLWGFVQIEYQHTEGSEIVAGGWADQPMAANLIGPDLQSASTFNIKRARLGVRGTIPGFNNFNYLISIDGGNNGVTKYGNGVALVDASISATVQPWLRFRAGQFKYPGSEEGMSPATRRHYVDDSTVVNQLLNETFFDGDGSGASANTPNGARGCYHDIGLQLFGVMPLEGRWEHTYAAMLGNGNGMNRSDNNEDLDYYLYWASEWVFAGKGKQRDGLKLYGWWQEGRRTLTTDGAGTYDRRRSGAGITFHKDIFRLTGEYVRADGMIPNGTDGSAVAGAWNNSGTQVASCNLLPEEEAEGWYVDAGVRMLSRLWVDARYDRLNRGTEFPENERQFDTITAGLEYHFNPNARLMINYAWRTAEAPYLSASSAANLNLDHLDDKITAQLQLVFP